MTHTHTHTHKYSSQYRDAGRAKEIKNWENSESRMTRKPYPLPIFGARACYYSVQNLLSSSLLSKKLKIKIYRTIILPVVLYGCETWSLTLREERRLSVFENRVLRRVFGPKRDEVTGEWRKLHNEELSDMYALLNIVRVVKSRRIRWAGHVERMGQGRGVHRVLVGRPEGKRPLGRPRLRWEDNIKMNFRKLEGIVGTGWSWLRIGTGGGHL